MDWLEDAKKIVDPNYIRLGKQNLLTSEKKIKTLIKDQSLPQDYQNEWSDEEVRYFLNQLSFLDSNNFSKNIGLGEREGRVFSNLVKQRNLSFSHGIGRSGTINAIQPKAAGSSLILQLCNKMALQALKLAGARLTKKCMVLPLCTGMSLALALRALGFQKEQELEKKKKENKDKIFPDSPKYVIWSRIDQKTCLKCIYSAGFKPIVVDQKIATNKKTNETMDYLVTDTNGIEESIKKIGADNIVCVLSTTSCFSPRSPDNVLEISKICERLNVPHLINNAYGVQCMKTMTNINNAMKNGRVDAYVQSTDKNFQVPIGGGIVASKNPKFIDLCSSMYAGRANMSPILDLFITLLQTSQKRWVDSLKARKNLMLKKLLPQIRKVAEKYGERLLKTDKVNQVSFAVTLDGFKDPVDVGGKLYYKQVTGPRVVVKTTKKTIMDKSFVGYGTHCDDYPHHYVVMSCAIGTTEEIVNEFVKKFDKTLKEVKKNDKKSK